MDWDNVYGSNYGVDEVDKGQYEKTRITDFTTGACVLLKGKALKDIGLFDEKYFMYLEDADLISLTRSDNLIDGARPMRRKCHTLLRPYRALIL